MRYNIEGFDQQKAINFGLDLIDLSLLRWFVDFTTSPKMKKMIVNDKIYYWINYKHVIEEMPILGLQKVAIARRFKKMADNDVLIHITDRDGGTYSYFGFGKNLSGMIFKVDGCTQKSEGGSTLEYEGVVLESANKDSSTSDPSIKKDSIIGASPEKESKPRRVTKVYGEFRNVKLTDDELKKLQDKWIDWKEKLEIFSTDKELHGYKYTNDYLALLKWRFNDVIPKQAEQKRPTFNDSIPLV